ncbi:MAG: zinc ribbon domain-containing protein [Anaerolineae bacterium]|nr:zinc ribbon domain-containing protein [Anaerolineae bacterium]
MFDWEAIGNLALIVITALGAFGAALWLSLTLWTFRDIRTRSRDPFAQILATVVVAILNLPGIIVYLILRPPETLTEAYERSLEEEALLQSIEDRAVCPGCGRTARDNWQVCPYCHTKLKKVCVNCGALLDLSWNICPHCATAQIGYAGPSEPEPVAIAPPASAPEKTHAAPARREPRTAREDTALYPDDAFDADDVYTPLGESAPEAKPEDAPAPVQRSSDRRPRRRRAPQRGSAVQFIEDDDF